MKESDGSHLGHPTIHLPMDIWHRRWKRLLGSSMALLVIFFGGMPNETFPMEILQLPHASKVMSLIINLLCMERKHKQPGDVKLEYRDGPCMKFAPFFSLKQTQMIPWKFNSKRP